MTWQTRWPTHGSGYQTQIDLEVTVKRAGEVYELSWPAEWLERNAAMARGEKGR